MIDVKVEDSGLNMGIPKGPKGDPGSGGAGGELLLTEYIHRGNQKIRIHSSLAIISTTFS